MSILQKYDYELLRSVGNNDIKKLREMIDTGVDINMKEYEKGTTPLHIAAARGNKQALELLVTRGADVNAQDNRGITPLHSLVTNRYDVLALWLIRHGANIHLADNNNFSAYDLAQGWFQKEMVAASEGKPVISQDLEERTSPMFQILSKPARETAVTIDNSEVVKIYYQQGNFKSIKISSTETARDICKRMAEKFNMTAYDKCFDMLEVVKNESRFFNANEPLLVSKAKWPIIVGTSGNETHLHCRFEIALRKSAPKEAQELFSRI
ncbi:ankyrin repeat-containing protein [Heterostelium album PN500]|uniref:Ankyrin repeat-containing protein n=1 Tax=Heterostelium pallidum (strain ATCC 26659 / Pp 5 / PN500) TaxID=670386 RepID=D3BIF8_HETP5|nr:ankyrin repeat-containing protein [Heterostelium album PN500]EFA79058.1 ankyrin repeat-containing protein [Heterostelium album PN500]|eukprot:XP_020431181.1 ankyrin repeat-containing protein [Heterostelium album PN500]